MKRLFLISAILVFIFSTTFIHCSASLNSTKARATMSSAGPILKDPSIQVKRIFSGLRYPTSMAFLGPHDILVLEKDEGTVQRIVNGNILGEPLLQVKVDRTDERGMLGIAISRNETKNATYVFLYYTEFKPIHHSQGITLGNRLYRYELVGNKLVNPNFYWIYL
ncbi:MAG TPA: PQQ-dependent sugar dehydrogenase [Nitrososphaeraceae archaeon]